VSRKIAGYYMLVRADYAPGIIGTASHKNIPPDASSGGVFINIEI
jgi:hypothetical protein